MIDFVQATESFEVQLDFEAEESVNIQVDHIHQGNRRQADHSSVGWVTSDWADHKEIHLEPSGLAEYSESPPLASQEQQIAFEECSEWMEENLALSQLLDGEA